MAFSTSNVSTANMGSLNALTGNFTSSSGDANGTIKVGSARILMAHAYDQSAATPALVPLPYSVTTSGNNSTVSFNVSKGVSAGLFLIIYA